MWKESTFSPVYFWQVWWSSADRHQWWCPWTLWTGLVALTSMCAVNCCVILTPWPLMLAANSPCCLFPTLYNIISCVYLVCFIEDTTDVVWRIQPWGAVCSSITCNPFRQISVEFSMRYKLSLETLEPRLQFKMNFCGFEQSSAMQHGFEWWTGKVKQYTIEMVMMIFLKPTLVKLPHFNDFIVK